MSHANIPFVCIFGGPQIFDSKQVRIDLAPRTAVLIGLVALSGAKGLPVGTAIQYLWHSGTDRLLSKRLDQLLRSYHNRHRIAPTIYLRERRISLIRDSYHSDYSQWASSLTHGDIPTAVDLWGRGLLPLHRSQLTTAGESYLLAQEKRLREQLEWHGGRLLDELNLRADWPAVARISASLHSVFPSRVRYSRALLVSLLALGRRFEAEAHLDRMIESGLLTMAEAGRLFRLQWQRRSEDQDNLKSDRAVSREGRTAKGSPRDDCTSPPLLLGRRNELEALQRLLNKPASHGRVHGVIHGRLGSGKTALLQCVRAYAESIGYSTITISCKRWGNESPARSSCAPCNPGGHPDHEESDVDVAREVRRHLFSETLPSSEHIGRMVTRLGGQSPAGPVLICIDDIDIASFGMERLTDILSHPALRLSCVRLVATVTGLVSDVTSRLNQFIQVVTISDLGPDDRLSLLSSLCPSEPSAANLGELQFANLGVPAFIVGFGELLRDQEYTQEKTEAADGVLHPDFVRYLRQHTKALNVPTRQVLNLLACAEHRLAVVDVQRIVNCDRQAVLTALAQLQALNICFVQQGYFSIPWPRLRGHLVSQIAEPERADLLLRLSSQLSSSFSPSANRSPALSLANAYYRLYLEDLERCKEIAINHEFPGGSIDDLRRQLRLLGLVQKRAGDTDPRLHARIGRVLMQLGQGDRARYWFDRASRDFRLRGQSKEEYTHRCLASRASRFDPSADLGEIHSQTKALFADSLRRGWWEISARCLDLRLRLYEHSFDMRGIRGLLYDTLTLHDEIRNNDPTNTNRNAVYRLHIMCYTYSDPGSAWEYIKGITQPILNGQGLDIDAHTQGIIHAVTIMLGKHNTPEGSALLEILGEEQPGAKIKRDSPFTRMNQVVILLNSWQYDDAIAALHNLLGQNSIPSLCAKTGLIHANLSVAHARSRQWPEALAHIKQASDRLGCRPPGAVRSGISAVVGLEALERGAFSEANRSLAFLEAIPAECPYDRVLPTKLRVQWAWHHGRREQALWTLDEAIRMSKADKAEELYFRYIKAKLLARTDRTEEANNLWRICAQEAAQHGLHRAHEMALAQTISR